MSQYGGHNRSQPQSSSFFGSLFFRLSTKRTHHRSSARAAPLSRGTPIPLWVSEDGSEVVAIGSIAELRELSGDPSVGHDLHREFVDQITIPSRKSPKGPRLRRIDEVFDCWFESGSMPYAQLHYPFENKERFEKGFPADFIAEGLDQTRGWFYTLMVISTALFDKVMNPTYKRRRARGAAIFFLGG